MKLALGERGIRAGDRGDRGGLDRESKGEGCELTNRLLVAQRMPSDGGYPQYTPAVANDGSGRPRARGGASKAFVEDKILTRSPQMRPQYLVPPTSTPTSCTPCSPLGTERCEGGSLQHARHSRTSQRRAHSSRLTAPGPTSSRVTSHPSCRPTMSVSAGDASIHICAGK